LSVIFGTHNRDSVDTIIGELEKTGLAKKMSESGKLRLREDVAGRVGIAQLYGEC
jgi:proline dehydrogenase